MRVVFCSILVLCSRILVSSHAPCRAEAKQDCERLRTPPTPLRQNSLVRSANSSGRHTDDEGSLRRRAVKVGGQSNYTAKFEELLLLICQRSGFTFIHFSWRLHQSGSESHTVY